MVVAFVITLFLSSSLLFLVQPMVGKMILPSLGGVPAVWNTCMVFFQAVLLVGYAYSHVLTTKLRLSRQVAVHLVVMALPLIVLPIAVSTELVATVPTTDFPVLWLLGTLVVVAGLPFFVVSTMAPTLQRWFSLGNHRDSQDPYFLYAASNAGSMVGLLAYPFLLEPLASLSEQSGLWHIGYGALFALAMACAGVSIYSRHKGKRNGPVEVEKAVGVPDQAAPTARRRLEWILFAFVPSSLMLGLTTYISTDVASVPLLWVIPLALYLLTFILVFARRPIHAPPWVGRGMCLVAMAIMVAFLAGATHPFWVLLVLHLVLYFAASMVAHGRLAKSRPAPGHLTEYFLLMSVGGVLGGIFNALVAPLIFTRVVEYMLIIAVACGIREVGEWEKKAHQPYKDLWMPLLPGALLLALIFSYWAFNLDLGRFVVLFLFAPVALLNYSFVERPRRFALGLVVILGLGAFYDNSLHHGQPLHHERNFYGTIKVVDDLDDRFRMLIDGNTIHGKEALGAESCKALSYYHPTGPVGAFFDMHVERMATVEETSHIALVGVGIGSVACYGRPTEHWDLYEINPAVVGVAEDRDLFTILDKAPVGSYEFIVGDARLRLQTATSHYEMIVVDAFSSGSIPVHLLTLEAFDLYISRLTPDGHIIVNISNRVLDLAPVLANVADAAGLVAYSFEDTRVLAADARAGKDPSHWIVLAR
ncbi:MAG: spermidine synthase, partial [Bradymonadaceae bacterium]